MFHRHKILFSIEFPLSDPPRFVLLIDSVMLLVGLLVLPPLSRFSSMVGFRLVSN